MKNTHFIYSIVGALAVCRVHYEIRVKPEIEKLYSRIKN
jgi:hypothetical protein